MHNPYQWTGSLHSNPELFVYFTTQGICSSLTRLKLSTGKLPQATLVNMRRSLTDQYPALIIKDSGSRHMYTHRNVAHCIKPCNGVNQVRYSALILT